MKTEWSRFLNEKGFCSEGVGGNRPCDNGELCERCQADWVTKEFEGWKLKQQTNTEDDCGIIRSVELTNKLKEHLSVKAIMNWGSVSPCILYKDVPLWRTGGPLAKTDIFVMVPNSDDDEPYTLICKDSTGDYYTYGAWDSAKEVEAWLENPKPF